MVKRAWRILAPLLASPLMIGGAVARPLDEVMQAGTLRIAVYRDNPPSFYQQYVMALLSLLGSVLCSNVVRTSGNAAITVGGGLARGAVDRATVMRSLKAGPRPKRSRSGHGDLRSRREGLSG